MANIAGNIKKRKHIVIVMIQKPISIARSQEHLKLIFSNELKASKTIFSLQILKPHYCNSLFLSPLISVIDRNFTPGRRGR